MALAEFSEDVKTVAVRQVEVEKDERQIPVRGDEPHRFLRVCPCHDDRLAAQLSEDAAERLADQHMVVDNKDLHPGDLVLQAAAVGTTLLAPGHYVVWR